MKKSLIDGWNSFLRLVRFLAWYAGAVVAIFLLLPHAGPAWGAQHAALSGVIKFSAVLGLFVVVGAWQVLSMRDRWLRPPQPA